MIRWTLPIVALVGLFACTTPAMHTPSAAAVQSLAPNGTLRAAINFGNPILATRDPATGGYVMLGKTFKGMTDAMLAWQTERFQELETHRDDYTVHVRPEQVVEIAFDGIQKSSRYRGGMALRFARVLRYRDDKTAAEADTIETVRSLRGW